MKELLELARSHVPEAIKLAGQILTDEARDDRVRLEAAKLVLAYGIGAPPKQTQEDDDVGALSKAELYAQAKEEFQKLEAEVLAEKTNSPQH